MRARHWRRNITDGFHHFDLLMVLDYSINDNVWKNYTVFPELINCMHTFPVQALLLFISAEIDGYLRIPWMFSVQAGICGRELLGRKESPLLRMRLSQSTFCRFA